MREGLLLPLWDEAAKVEPIRVGFAALLSAARCLGLAATRILLPLHVNLHWASLGPHPEAICPPPHTHTHTSLTHRLGHGDAPQIVNLEFLDGFAFGCRKLNWGKERMKGSSSLPAWPPTHQHTYS